MFKRIASFLAATAILALSGCAITPARMALPAPLSTEPELAFEGMGFGQRGRFRAGPYTAHFTRSDTRLALLDALVERRSGETSFTLQGPDIDGVVDAECKVAERTITISVISFTPKPMAYRCRFARRGRLLPGWFELQEQRSGLGGMLMRQSRRGEIVFGDEVLQIASVHGLEGSGFQTAIPIGYLFEKDGKPAGAVELNGRPVVRFAADSDAETRRAVMIAATALGVLWDPADSPLGREAG